VGSVASDGLPPVPTPAALTGWQVTGSWRPASITGGRRMVVTTSVVLGLAVCALVILWQIGSSTGSAGFALGACLAALPVPLLVWSFRWLDRYEPEPIRVVLFTLAWGAAVATLGALFLNRLGGEVFVGADQNEDLTGTAVFVAPPVEEFAKGLVIVLLAWRGRVDGIVDGIVLAGLAGVGFAFTENILYLGSVYSTLTEQEGSGTGALGLVLVFVLRGIVSPFAHPLFTMATGVGVGVAVASRRRSVRVGAPIAGYAVAMLLHGTWNATASSGLDGFAISYAAVMLPVFGLGVLLAVWFRRREGMVLRRRLPAFAEAGWIAPHEVAVLSSLWLRRLFLDVARFGGGAALRRATRDYHDLVTTLAFQRERLARGRRVERTIREQVETLASLPATRAHAFVPPPPPLPPTPPSGWSAPSSPWNPADPWGRSPHQPPSPYPPPAWRPTT
jgi:RsiW-degrading membrane proteinase PrsW (M82 family)